MAITILNPAVLEGIRRPILKGLPSLSVEAKKRTSSSAFTLIMGGFVMFNLLALLVINTLMTQDAFTLQDLKHQANTVNDERDAIMRQVAQFNSPDSLAAQAIKIGMKPVEKLNYVDLGAVAVNSK